jgi:hypothetical protein
VLWPLFRCIRTRPAFPKRQKSPCRNTIFFAYGTLWLTFAAVLVATLCAWKPTRIVKVGLCAVLLFSTLAVAITGHHGGTLAYVHGIGVQGQFLSTH